MTLSHEPVLQHLAHCRELLDCYENNLIYPVTEFMIADLRREIIRFEVLLVKRGGTAITAR